MSSSKEISSQNRPWVRCFARLCDYCLLKLFLTAQLILVATITGKLLNFPSYKAWFFAIPFSWIVVETLLLSTWGTTPGKWLLTTSIRDIRGNKLSHQTAFLRSAEVWVKGVGLGVPIICCITQIISFNQLTKPLGKTSWDLNGECIVNHSRLNPLGVMGVIAIIGINAVLGYY